MQDVVVPDLLIRIKMKPALAAFFLRAAVPRDRQGLPAAVREVDQILLQRIDAEGVFHLEGGELSVRAVGLDKKFAALAEEPGAYVVIIEARVVEIAEHRRIVRVLHRVLVLGRTPQLRLLVVAARARLASDECRACRGLRTQFAEKQSEGGWPPNGQSAQQNSQASQRACDQRSLPPTY